MKQFNNEIEIEDSNYDSNAVRPLDFENYIGQDKIKNLLKMAIHSSKERVQTLDHILFYGPPGLGKTTISQIIANEIGSNIKIITGNLIEKAGDIAAILTSLEEGDVLFIDEIHRLPRIAEETIYSAMEDFKLHITINKDIQTQSITVDLPRFTLIGATTRSGLLTKPLYDRFGFVFRMEYYTTDQLQNIIIKAFSKLTKQDVVSIEHAAAEYIAQHSRMTPRIAIKLLKRVIDYCIYHKEKIILLDSVKKTLEMLNIKEHGLEDLEVKYLDLLRDKNKPLALNTIATSLNEDVRTIEDMVEPYLIEMGFIEKTSRGRILSGVFVK
jgi:Holliday junction DNA helicase RuvB